MYLQTRRKDNNNKEYIKQIGQKRTRSTRSNLPCRCDHTHSDEEDDMVKKRENNYELAPEEPFRIFRKESIRPTSTRYQQRIPQRKLGLQMPNTV